MADVEGKLRLHQGSAPAPGDLSVLTFGQSGLTKSCKNVEEEYLFISHTARAQPGQTPGWLQVQGQQGASPTAEAGPHEETSVSAPARRPEHHQLCSPGEAWCSEELCVAFPGEGPLAGPSDSLEQIMVSGKAAVISRAVWTPGLPSCLAGAQPCSSRPRSTLSAHSH